MTQSPRNGNNGGSSRPNGQQSSQSALAPVSTATMPQDQKGSQDNQQLVRNEGFDQPVVLQQTSFWSHAIVWGIAGVTVFTLVWAAIAKVEEAVPATGKLEPVGAVQEVQVPVDGVVEEILVENGDRVEEGEVMLRLDTEATEAQLAALEHVFTSLQYQNVFYRSQLLGATPEVTQEILETLPPEMLALTSNRNALLQENELYRALLSGATATNLSLEQQARLQALQLEAQSRTSAADLEIAQIERQLAQNQVQLAAARENLEINQRILADVTPLAEEGGLARLQLTRQQQEVLNSEAEVAGLIAEQQRLEFAISQAQQQLQNTVAVTNTDVLNRMSDNDERLAEIDSQLNQAIVDNENRLAELVSQISQAEQTLRYQEVRAPIDGVIFDMQAQTYGVVGNTPEPVLKIVPGDSLVARVFITNRDIGFVEEGMEVDVRIDSFPFSEFGDIQGTLTWIGSDALPPDEIRPVYTFPAEIELDAQSLNISGREVVLQSGMSVSVNIKIRSRTILSIFTDLFVRKVDSLTNSR